MKAETNALKAAIIKNADPIKEKVHFSYYRLMKGISDITLVCKKKASDYGFGQNVRNTVNFALS